MATKKVKFMCTAFRDGFQSVYGARVRTQDFIPAVKAAVEAGITYFESGGGAMFQSPFFYSNESAFDMMDAFRAAVGPDVNLQTLARGVNVVGLDSNASDVITAHARLFKKHGVTTIRNFDALNDVNNLIFSGKAIVDAGLKHEVCVTLMALPPGCSGAHDPAFYEKSLKDILDAGIPYDSVCFKDASGTTTPSVVFETVKRARKLLPEGTLIHFHTHDTAGIGVSCYKAALDAGADLIDLSLAPCSGGTCQADVLTMWHALRGTDFELDVDINKVLKAEEVFKECMKDYFLPPEATMVEPLIPWSPMPGGALTANTQMLRDNNLMHKYDEVIAAMSEVVRRGGFGTSVTPVSQFYFQQAFNNVMFGPWKKVADGYGKMVLGYFGKTPVAPDPEIVKLCAEQLKLEPTTKTVLEICDADPKKGMTAARKTIQAAGLPETEENIFIAATCGDKGIAFLKGEAKANIRFIEKEKPAAAAKAAAAAGGAYTVTVDGKKYSVKLDGAQATVNGKTFTTAIADGIETEVVAAPAGKLHDLVSPMPGIILKINASVGDHVTDGDPLVVMEAMKMESVVNTTVTGTVREILVNVGDQVNGEVVLLRIG